MCTQDGDSGYASQLESLRSTTKWLIAACAGVAVLLLSGLQLTGLAGLRFDSWRPYAAIGSVLAVLAAIGFMIKAASTVLVQEWLTLASFTDDAIGLCHNEKRLTGELRGIERRLDTNHNELFGHVAGSISELHRGLQSTHEELRAPGTDPARREAAVALSEQLRAAARDTVQAANFYVVLHLFRRMRRRIAWASVVVVAGIRVYAFACQVPAEDEPVKVTIVSLSAAAGTAGPTPDPGS